MKKLYTIALIAIAHCLVAGFLFISSFHLMLDPNDHPPTLYQQIAAPVSKFLLYPLFVPLSKVVPRVFSGLLGYIPMYLNSIVWALVIVFVSNKFRVSKLGEDKRTA